MSLLHEAQRALAVVATAADSDGLASLDAGRVMDDPLALDRLAERFLPALREALGASAAASGKLAWDGRGWLAGILGQGEPEAAVAAVVEGLRAGMPVADVSCAILLQSALRLAQMPEDAPEPDRGTAREGLRFAALVDRALLAATLEPPPDGERARVALAPALLLAAARISHLQRSLGLAAPLPEPTAEGADEAGSVAHERDLEAAWGEALQTGSASDGSKRPGLPPDLFGVPAAATFLDRLERAARTPDDGALLAAARHLDERMPGKPVVTQALAAIARQAVD